MIPAIRSEFRKLLTVRATYILIVFCLAVTVFFSFYVEGFHQVQNVSDPHKLGSEVTSAAQALSLFVALVGVLLVTHEYRYNTILYSLTAASRRGYVLLAKVVVVSVFAILATLILSSLSPLLAELGLHAKGLTMVAQDFPIKDLLTRAVLYGWGYSMLALIIALIVRHQVGVIAILFFLPGLIESLLGFLLKDNVKYLPFHSLDAVLSGPGRGGYPTDITVMLSYIVGGLLIAWLLFERRDAN